MSKTARRRNRRRGGKNGFRREAGPTSRPKIRELREAVAASGLEESGAVGPEPEFGPQGAGRTGRSPAGLDGARITAQQPASADGVERLLCLARDLGLSEADVDELVYDLVHSGASSSYNNGAYPELVDIDAFDAVHDDADEAASRINNQGLAAQIEALVDAFGEAGAEQLVRDAAAQ